MMSLFSRRSCLIPFFALSFALVLTGCGEKSAVAQSGDAAKSGGKGGGKGGRGGTGPAPVIVAQAKKKIVPLVIEAIGAVEPIRTTAIRSQVTGNLMKIAFQEGQNVK